MRRPALIFDFGNVFAYFDYARAFAGLGRRLGLSGEDFLTRARACGLDQLVRDYERGVLRSEEFSAAVCRRTGLVAGHDEFAAAWSDIFWLNPPVADLCHTLRAGGYTLILGSNTNEIHSARFRGQFARELACFDRLVLSHEIGHSKPSADFYLECARAAGAAPSDCVFIDDMRENVDGARAAGLAAIRFTDLDSLVAALRGLGVED